MIYVGIDVAKDKHDCCILESEADKLYPVFTIPNNKAGFDELYEKIFTVTDDKTKINVGLEATGHYRYILPQRGAEVINSLSFRQGSGTSKTQIFRSSSCKHPFSGTGKTRSQPSYGFDVCLAVQTPRSLLHYRMSSYPSQKSPRNSL